MPWKMVTMNNKNVTLVEAVDSRFSRQESEAEEQERREKEREEIEKKHMKKETDRLKDWVNWYGVKLNEIREAPVDERLQKL